MVSDPNREILLLIAKALGDLCEQFIFVGGCATGLLVTIQRAQIIRPTDDVQVSADATDKSNSNNQNNQGGNTQNVSGSATQLAYRTLIKLDKQNLEIEEDKLHLTPGMQVAAEIKLADQTVMQYLLSPVTKAFHEAGRER